eukprot:40585-Eustigmatos_ZCMA.PRE.1
MVTLRCDVPVGHHMEQAEIRSASAHAICLDIVRETPSWHMCSASSLAAPLPRISPQRQL